MLNDVAKQRIQHDFTANTYILLDVVQATIVWDKCSNLLAILD